VPFTPYATVKDALALSIFLLVFAYFIFFMPNFLGHADNYIPADPLKTPAHIVPEWYFLPFYAILRAITFNIGPIDSKLGGVLAMFGSIAVLFVLPWLDTSKVRSAVYRPWYKLFFWIFRGQRDLPGMARREACGRHLHPAGADLDALLLCVLPGHPAGAGAYRNAEASAQLDHRSRARQKGRQWRCCSCCGITGNPRLSGARRKGTEDMKKLLASIVPAAMALVIGAGSAFAAGYPINKPREVDWSFAGPFGTFDKGQLQRGLKVYVEACSACHSMNLVAFRTLEDLGYSEDQVKALAANYEVEDGPNGEGEMFTRPAVLSDHFPSPFPNQEAAAYANNGAAPPDFSLLAKARYVERGFPQFMFDIFHRLQRERPELHLFAADRLPGAACGCGSGRGTYYNPYFIAGSALAMAQPIYDEQVAYDDGSPETVDQYAKDVAAFLMWAAEPHMEERKQTGFMVIIFLAIFASLLFLTKKSVFASKEH
jgi:cytochrome c1